MCKTYLAKPVCRACLQPDSPLCAGEAVYVVCGIAMRQRKLCRSITPALAEYIVGNTRCDACLRGSRPYAGESIREPTPYKGLLISPKFNVEALGDVKYRSSRSKSDHTQIDPDRSDANLAVAQESWPEPFTPSYSYCYNNEPTYCGLPPNFGSRRSGPSFQQILAQRRRASTRFAYTQSDSDTSDSDSDIVTIARRRRSSVKPFNQKNPDKIPVWFDKNKISGTPAEAEAFRLQQLLFLSNAMPEVPAAARAAASCRVACDRNGINLPYRTLINEAGIDMKMSEMREICQKISRLVLERNWDEKLRKARKQHGGWGMAGDFRKLSVEMARRHSEPIRKRSDQSGIKKS